MNNSSSTSDESGARTSHSVREERIWWIAAASGSFGLMCLAILLVSQPGRFVEAGTNAVTTVGSSPVVADTDASADADAVEDVIMEEPDVVEPDVAEPDVAEPDVAEVAVVPAVEPGRFDEPVALVIPGIGPPQPASDAVSVTPPERPDTGASARPVPAPVSTVEAPVAPVAPVVPADPVAPVAPVAPVVPDPAAVAAAFEATRRDELSVLAGLSARVRFAPGEVELSGVSRQALDRMFEPLFVYADTDINVQISGPAGDTQAAADRLSQARASAIVDYLVERGLEPDRFDIEVEATPAVAGALPAEQQRVRVIAAPGRS